MSNQISLKSELVEILSELEETGKIMPAQRRKYLLQQCRLKKYERVWSTNPRLRSWFDRIVDSLIPG